MKNYISPKIDILDLKCKKILLELTLFSDNDIPVDEDEDETESGK